ncbi:MAG: DUF3352 domain-containing protein [Oscillatoriales cyanobacterium RM2_1_1]|nr:DUF3352 domain-containing protein [Oscillatoriales cyanobacterium SM2_3_0]NJO45909.1 DUF3352 domain-containing protein [Oscillatoriales cyanobacterium RM2_1_1]
MMPKTKPSPLLPLGLAALVIGGSVGAYYAFVSKRSVEGLPAGATVLPEDVMVALSVSTEPKQWERLQQYGTPDSKVALDKFLQGWRDRFFTDKGYDFQKDIQPWVGDKAMLAWLPHQTLASGQAPQPGTPLASPNQSALVAVLPIADPAKAQEILAQPRLLAEGEVLERTYRGINIIESQNTSVEKNYAVAVLGREFVVVANDTSALDRIIDAYRGEASLGKIPGYASALQKIEVPRSFAQVYLNVPVAANVASFTSSQPIPSENLAKLQQTQGFASNVILEPEGLAFKGVSWLKPNSQKTLAVENRAKNMLKRVPDSAIMVVSGGNLQQLWQDYTEGAQGNPIAPFNPDALAKSLKQSTGLELEKDFLNWMDGEFALSLIPANPDKENPQKFSAGFALMAQVSDRKAAEASLQKLDESVKAQNFQVGEAKIKDQSVTKWTSPYGGFTVMRGWLENNVLYMTLGAPIAYQFLPTPEVSVVTDPLFKQTLPPEPNPNNGNFFMNVDQAFDRQNLSLPQLPPQQQVWVNAIQSIGVTAAVANDRTTRYDTFVRLKTANPVETEDQANPEGSDPDAGNEETKN